jgi:hypothetical protein
MLAMRLCYLKAITSYFNVGINDVFPWESILKSLAISCISSVPVLLLYQFTFNVWGQLLIMGMAFSLCYLVLLKLVMSLTNNDKNAIREFLPRKIKWIL